MDRLNIVVADDKDDARKWSLCRSCLLMQFLQKIKDSSLS